MLDETRWPATSALIDEACGLTGNGLMVAEGPKDDVRAVFVGLYSRGQRREDLEREYLENYHAIDERVPRFRQLPASRLVHINDLYTAEELKTSPTYNEILRRAGMQDGLNVRLPGLDGSHIGWGLNDPVDSEGWGASRITRVQRLLPHIQQFVRVRQALVRAGARSTTVTALLDNPRIGVLFRLWRELGGGVREIGGAELEDRLRWDRVSLGKAHSEAVREIDGEQAYEKMRRAIRAGGERIRQVAELDDRARRGSPKDGRSHHEIDRRLRGSEQLIQHAREGSGRAHSLIHAEAEQKRKAGHRWDRVESKIESLIQGRVRSRDRREPEL